MHRALCVVTKIETLPKFGTGRWIEQMPVAAAVQVLHPRRSQVVRSLFHFFAQIAAQSCFPFHYSAPQGV